MAVPSGDYRPLLSGGLWLAGGAAIAASLNGIAGNSDIASALGFELILISVTAWAAMDLHCKRDLPSANGDLELANDLASSSVLASQLDVSRQAVQLHATVIGGVASIVGLFAGLQLFQLSAMNEIDRQDAAVSGIVCLVVAFVWLVLARSFQSIREHELPEAPPLASAFREGQWAFLMAAAGSIGTTMEPRLAFWTTRLLLVWILIVCLESVLRLIGSLLVPPQVNQRPVSPICLLSRELVFASSNPITSLVRTIENRSGLSLASSWAIGFVRSATLPLLIFLLLLSWGLTSLVVVETHQFAVREHFGKTMGDVLTPGMHLKLPWPFGRIRAFPVKTVQQRPIGFIEDDDPVQRDQPRALLWTKPHAKEELALALGNGSELVSVNALVYFKIAEDRAGFLDYVYQQSTAEEALVAFAYRALMEETRGRTLDDVLSANRAAFSRRVVESVRRQASAARLGLDVIDLALLNLHPPIDAGGGFLEVINARLDAKRRVIEAEGEKQVALLNAKTRGAGTLATAKVEGRRRVASALGDMAEFKAVGEGLAVAPRTFRMRLWIQAIESALSDQRLFLVDRRLMDEGSDLMLDTRPVDTARSPLLNAPTPFPISGQKQND